MYLYETKESYIYHEILKYYSTFGHVILHKIVEKYSFSYIITNSTYVSYFSKKTFVYLMFYKSSHKKSNRPNINQNKSHNLKKKNSKKQRHKKQNKVKS